MSDELREQLLEHWRHLPTERQQLLVDLAKNLALARPIGVPSTELLRFAGTIPPDELDQMAKAIEEDCEKVDPDGW